MDLILVDGDARITGIVLESLALGGHRLLRAASEPGGHAWPLPGRTDAILLGFDLPTPARMRALHRLWAGDDAAAAYLVTAPGSVGDCILSSLLGPRCATTEWAPAPPLAHHRCLRELSIEHLLSLERLVQGDDAARATLQERTQCTS